MGAVIKFPWGRRLRGRPAGTPDASAAVIILPVIRIERSLAASSPVKTRTAKSATKPVAKAAARSAPERKRRKRLARELPSPACSGG
jgi:hypothetical protein